MDIFEIIRDEHGKHRTLLDLVSKTVGASDGRAELFARLRQELLSHAAAEERCFYSVLMDIKSTRGKATHSVEEHEEMRDLLAGLSDMAHDNPNWIRALDTLKDRVEHHMAEEEDEIFKAAKAGMTEAQAQEAGRRFAALKAGWTEADEDADLDE